MPFPLLGVPPHLQDDPDGCALACGQMVVRFISQVLLQQSDLRVLPVDPVWSVSPAQLEQGLNAALSGYGSTVRYAAYAETSTDALMQRLAMALNASLPAIVLTSTHEHWVVVHGITEAASSLTIHIRNPLPDRDSAIGVLPLPQHTDTDTCSDLDIANSGEFDGEIAPCHDWEQVYLVRSAFAPVVDKYVVVVPVQTTAPPELYRCPAAAGKNRRMPDDGSIGEFAWSQLVGTNVLTREGWNQLSGAPPDFAIARQLRVVNPADATVPFLLVEVRNASGITVLIRLHADTGAFLGALLHPSDRLTTALFSSPQDVPWLRQHVPPGVSTRAVWSYGKTSLYSPFVPLLEVTAPGGVRYVRLFDGKVFTELQSYSAT